jgi:hypothetical protein
MPGEEDKTETRENGKHARAVEARNHASDRIRDGLLWALVW